MTEQPPRRPAERARLGKATTVAVALLALSACSGAPDSVNGAVNSHEQAIGASAPPSPSPSASAAGDPVKAAQEQARQERAAAAPSGDTITPGPQGTDGGEDRGVPILTDGDLTVYRPRKEPGGIITPVKITNHGEDRAFYTVDLRITGPAGFDSVFHLDTDTVGVYPNTDWPTELTAADPGKPIPEDPKVTVLRSDRQPFPR
ncbi:hypothetical protein [Streptomyces sp. NPDC090445]|uniref:hypothetical protein n=1 Tax=Streptomyces sp. NPDC090445 TaxID=3365963 RepID=UPI00380EC5E1